MNVRLRVAGFGMAVAGAITFAYLAWRTTIGQWSWMQTAGVCLMVAGFPLWLLAHAQLGASFAVSAQARTLVTHGLYARIRNPIYLFGSIGIAGLFLFAGRPALLLLFLVLIPVQIKRIRSEAGVLEEKFGEEYREYRRQTWI